MMKKGFWYALAAYFAWGLLPIYWKLLSKVNAVQMIVHRVVWSFCILIIIVIITGQMRILISHLANKRVLLIYAFAAILIGVNWYMYVWAVNSNHIIETSLGYFINPLISVVFGVLFFRERLRPFQWASLSLALVGVLYLTLMYGRLPWIALTLAVSFGLYGLMKKIAPLPSLFGLTLETGFLFIPAVTMLVIFEVSGKGYFLHDSVITSGLLIGAGLVTSVPLLLFASAAQEIPLAMVGIMQYIAPTMQFLLGLVIFHEDFTFFRLIGFGFIWFSLLLFIIEGLVSGRDIAVSAGVGNSA